MYSISPIDRDEFESIQDFRLQSVMNPVSCDFQDSCELFSKVKNLGNFNWESRRRLSPLSMPGIVTTPLWTNFSYQNIW